MSLKFGEFELDQERRQLLRSGQPVPLEPKAYELLCLLVERRPKALTRAQIRDVVWPDTNISESTLGVVVNGLRQALGDDAQEPRFIRTVRGFGYSFCGEVLEKLEVPETAGVGGDSRPAAATAREGAPGLWPFLVSLALVALLVSAAWFWVWRGAPLETLPPAKVVPLTSLPGRERAPALSPDGSRVAFSWAGETGDNWDIYVKQVGAETLLRLTSDPGEDAWPAWSPDGLHVAFSRQTEEELAYFVVPALGGRERQVHTIPPTRALWAGQVDWSPDGRSLALAGFTSSPRQGIILLSLETLEAAPPIVASAIARAPAFSPDGSRLAYLALGTETVPGIDIYVVDVAGGEPRRLTFGNDGGQPAWTRNGREIVFASSRAGQPGLWRVAASGGAPEPVTPGGEGAGAVSVARDADRLVYARSVFDTDIWKIHVAGSALQGGRTVPVVTSTAMETEPHFSPEGERIAFVSGRSGHSEIWMCQTDGTHCAQLSSLEAPVCGAPRWSPNGREVAFDCRPEGSQDVFVVDVETLIVRPLTSGPSEDVQPSWSRDGRWVYFGSTRSGSWQIWKTPVAGGRVLQITTGGGMRARESADGSFLYVGGWVLNDEIKRVPLAGGEETLLLELPEACCWDVGEKGLYYLDTGTQPLPTIELFDPVTGAASRVAELEGDLFLDDAGLAVSPDGRSILYVGLETAEQDLMLIENFR